MSDNREQAERHPTDEPDGTPAYTASLRAPGESVSGAQVETDSTDDTEPEGRAGYEVGAVSGDSEIYRPD